MRRRTKKGCFHFWTSVASNADCKFSESTESLLKTLERIGWNHSTHNQQCHHYISSSGSWLFQRIRRRTKKGCFHFWTSVASNADCKFSESTESLLKTLERIGWNHSTHNQQCHHYISSSGSWLSQRIRRRTKKGCFHFWTSVASNADCKFSESTESLLKTLERIGWNHSTHNQQCHHYISSSGSWLSQRIRRRTKKGCFHFWTSVASNADCKFSESTESLLKTLERIGWNHSTHNQQCHHYISSSGSWLSQRIRRRTKKGCFHFWTSVASNADCKFSESTESLLKTLERIGWNHSTHNQQCHHYISSSGSWLSQRIRRRTKKGCFHFWTSVASNADCKFSESTESLLKTLERIGWNHSTHNQQCHHYISSSGSWLSQRIRRRTKKGCFHFWTSVASNADCKFSESTEDSLKTLERIGRNHGTHNQQCHHLPAVLP